MSDVLKLIRQELLTIKPFDVTRVGFANSILLDANELPWESRSADGVPLNRYVDGMSDPDVLGPVAEFYGVNMQQVLLTRGSCEGIDLLVRAFCRAYQDNIIICPPTFAIFAQCAQFQGAQAIAVPLIKEQDFALDVQGVLEQVTPNTKLLFVASPNNPTGNLIPFDQIVTLVEALQGKTMVVIDEAYLEFSKTQSATQLLDKYSNLVVLRTLSKAFGLAGLRAGVLLARPELIGILKGMMMPFAHSILTTEMIKQAFLPSNQEKMDKQIGYIQQQREVLKQEMEALPIVKKVYVSEGNFLLARFDDGKAIVKECLDNEILVRHFIGSAEYENYIRFTVGLKAQNMRLVQVLAGVTAKEAATIG